MTIGNETENFINTFASLFFGILIAVIISLYLVIRYHLEKKESSSDFSVDEFKNRSSIGKLCNVIENDVHGLSLDSDAKTIDWLNELIRKTEFSEEILQKKGENTLDKKTKRCLENLFKRYDQTKSPNDLRKFNRYLLQAFYPQETPKNHKGTKKKITISELVKEIEHKSKPSLEIKEEINETIEDKKEFASIIRQMLCHENDLTNQRLTWMATLNGLMLTGVGFVWGKQNGSLVIYLLCLVGVIINLSSSHTLYFSEKARKRLMIIWGEKAKSLPTGPRIIPPIMGYARASENSLSNMEESISLLFLPWNLLPWLLFILWIFVFVVNLMIPPHITAKDRIKEVIESQPEDATYKEIILRFRR
ncbi:MAG: hypothetical protein HGA78_06955 [Nitrospirales bacterium]|nr:hypothetical protein [Nitrospirales bacterium]